MTQEKLDLLMTLAEELYEEQQRSAYSDYPIPYAFVAGDECLLVISANALMSKELAAVLSENYEHSIDI